MSNEFENLLVNEKEQLPKPLREYLRVKARQWIKDNLVKDTQWHTCYSLKQTMTRKIGYCYSSDMFVFLGELGFHVKVEVIDFSTKKVAYFAKTRRSKKSLRREWKGYG